MNLATSALPSSVEKTMAESPADCSQIARLYRARAHQALSLARRARNRGNLDAALGLADEALLWRAYATNWARRDAAIPV